METIEKSKNSDLRYLITLSQEQGICRVKSIEPMYTGWEGLMIVGLIFLGFVAGVIVGTTIGDN